MGILLMERLFSLASGKSRAIKYFFIYGILFAFAACGSEPVYEEKTETDLLFSGRSRQEYLDDLDFLYNTLVENFPFFGVIYRSLGVDMHSYFHKTREHIKTTDNIWCDRNFAARIEGQFLSRANGMGHLGLIMDNRFLRLHIEAFSDDYYNDDGVLVNFLSEINNPTTRALFNLTDEDFKAPTAGEESTRHATFSRNIETKIIEAGRIAYVNILGMNFATKHLDEETLLNFFHEVSEYEHLIIDIRQNSGGDSRFFPQLVMAPNISRPLEWEHYLFLIGGEHNNHMLTPWMGALGEGYFQPITDNVINNLPYLSKDDLPFLDYYFRAVSTMYPSDHSPIFGGKIWLLVSEWVFSASEQAANMAQQTGFATLVGETTGGDGLGFQPIIVALPNTGIIVRYSAAYGVDNMGRNNQEFGTEPCFFNMPGKDALETVLYLIG